MIVPACDAHQDRGRCSSSVKTRTLQSGAAPGGGLSESCRGARICASAPMRSAIIAQAIAKAQFVLLLSQLKMSHGGAPPWAPGASMSIDGCISESESVIDGRRSAGLSEHCSVAAVASGTQPVPKAPPNGGAKPPTPAPSCYSGPGP